MLKLGNIAKATSIAPTFKWYPPNWNGEGEVPFILLEPAVAENAKWIAARMAWEKSSEGQRILRKAGNNPAAFAEAREVDIVMFAKVLVKGWGNLVDEDGKPVEFIAGDTDRTVAVLRAFGSSNIDDLRVAARTPSEKLSPAELGGN
jgi:hypothetical protein